MSDALEVHVVELAKLDLKPGDTLVLQSPRELRAMDHQNLSSWVASRFSNVQLLILDRGVTASVLRREDG